MSPISVNDELKRGSAELLILNVLESRPRHGYEISRLIEERSSGVIRFHVASFYPLLYRMERRGLIAGKWLEKPGQRRRRYYRLTKQGRTRLQQQRGVWREFAEAMNQLTEPSNA